MSAEPENPESIALRRPESAQPRRDTPRLLENLAALLTVADAVPVLQHFSAQSGGISALATHHHKVGNVDGPLLLDDPSLAAMGAGALVPLDEVHLLHHRPVLLNQDLEDLAGLALLFAGNHLDRVVFLDVKLLL